MNLRELHKGLSGLSPEQRALFARRLAESGWGPQGPEIHPRTTGDEPVPASLVQQRLWLLDQMEPGNPFYNLPLLCFQLRGELRLAPMERCFQEIERRHESLRTVFVDRDGVPFQRILPWAPGPLPLIDLSALPGDRREALAWELAREESRRLFDLARGPLWRRHLIRLDSRDHLLLVTMHHIVSDAWSLGRESALGVDQPQQGVDLSDVRERMGEVAQMTARHRVDLLGVETEPALVGEEPLREGARTLDLAD